MGDATKALFEAMFALEDIRQVLRESAPKHELDQNQRQMVRDAVLKVEKNLALLKRL